MTPAEKEAAKLELRTKITEHKLNTLDHWLYLMRADEQMRKCAGHSQGPEAMMQQLVKEFEKEQKRLMKPFDRGDYD